MTEVNILRFKYKGHRPNIQDISFNILTAIILGLHLAMVSLEWEGGGGRNIFTFKLNIILPKNTFKWQVILDCFNSTI